MQLDSIPASSHQRRFRPCQIGVAVITAGALLLTACTSSDPAAKTESTESTAVAGGVAPDKPGESPLADPRPVATPEQAYALSLPVLGHWLENDFDNAWIVTANTIDAAATTLDHAALDDTDYASWVKTFEQVIDVAAAVADGDQDGALAAFEPLIADHPGPYVDAAVDTSLSLTPYRHAEVQLDALDAAILAGDRDATRVAAGDTAEALAELVVTAQLDVSDGAADVLVAILPAFRAIDRIHDDVLTGTAKDAADAAALLRTSYESFCAAFPEASEQ